MWRKFSEVRGLKFHAICNEMVKKSTVVEKIRKLLLSGSIFVRIAFSGNASSYDGSWCFADHEFLTPGELYDLIEECEKVNEHLE